ncbi:MAG TPA: porin [Gammaproteobacteria bacterium]|nr:porin [Gammaproteobacteria bacterium]
MPVVVLCIALLCAGRANADGPGGGAPSGSPSLSLPQIHGRIYIDGQAYDHTRTTIASGLSVNNARLSLSGALPRDWRYLLEYDFAHRRIKYSWMRYEGFAPVRITVGQFKEPFSLEELTSTRFITFIERGLPNALVAGYRIGVGAERRAGSWTADLGIFSTPTSGYTVKTTGSGSWAVTGRFTWSPVSRKGALLHVGVDGSYRLAGNEHTFHVQQGPEAGRTEAYYLDTGSLTGVDHFATIGAEGAATVGAWSVQAEYVQTNVARRRGDPSLTFHGAYGFASWFPTGESRHYQGGRFSRVHPLRKAGALQLAARYSFLDLNSGPVAGGRERDITLGANWYFSPYTRLMFNYIKVHARLAGRMETPNIFLARLQSDF